MVRVSTFNKINVLLFDLINIFSFNISLLSESSLSSASLLNFLKSIATANFSLKREFWWIRLASNFLPVPKSPDINNLEFDIDCSFINFNNFLIKLELPIKGIFGAKILRI